jgi:hypothetical protein
MPPVTQNSPVANAFAGNRPAVDAPAIASSGFAEMTLAIADKRRASCVARVERALGDVHGVSSVRALGVRTPMLASATASTIAQGRAGRKTVGLGAGRAAIARMVPA